VKEVRSIFSGVRQATKTCASIKNWFGNKIIKLVEWVEQQNIFNIFLVCEILSRTTTISIPKGVLTNTGSMPLHQRMVDFPVDMASICGCWYSGKLLGTTKKLLEQGTEKSDEKGPRGPSTE
jgi:hypothetical protein